MREEKGRGGAMVEGVAVKKWCNERWKKVRAWGRSV